MYGNFTEGISGGALPSGRVMLPISTLEEEKGPWAGCSIVDGGLLSELRVGSNIDQMEIIRSWKMRNN